MHNNLFQHWRPWIIWFIGGIFILFQFMLQTSISVMIPQLMQDFRINAGEVGFLSSVFLYSYLFMQVPAGILIDRYGAKIVLIFAGIGSFIACFIFSTTSSLYLAECARLLMGLSLASPFVATLFLASNWFPAQRFALLVGLSEMMGMLGGIAGESNLAIWIEHFGWRYTLFSCGIIALILTAIVWLVLRDTPDKDSIGSHTIAPDVDRLRDNFIKVVKLPQVWLNGLFSACNFSVATAFAGLWAVPFFHTLYHSSLEAAAIASSMIFLGIAIGSPVIGALANYQSRRRGLMFFSTLAGLLLMLMILYGPHPPFLLMLIVLFCLGFLSSVYVIPFAVVRDITPRKARGTAMGVTNMLCIILGAPILQPLIGYFLEINHAMSSNDINGFTVADYRMALTTLPITLFLALLLIPFIKTQHEGNK